MSFHTQGIRTAAWRGKAQKPWHKKTKRDPSFQHWMKFAHPKEALKAEEGKKEEK